MENLSLRKLAVLLAALIAVSGMALLVLDPLPLQALRNQTFDQYQRDASLALLAPGFTTIRVRGHSSLMKRPLVFPCGVT